MVWKRRRSWTFSPQTTSKLQSWCYLKIRLSSSAPILVSSLPYPKKTPFHYLFNLLYSTNSNTYYCSPPKVIPYLLHHNNNSWAFYRLQQHSFLPSLLYNSILFLLHTLLTNSNVYLSLFLKISSLLQPYQQQPTFLSSLTLSSSPISGHSLNTFFAL